MSTRCATIVQQRTYTGPNDYQIDELFRFYRHCDGYPEGHGKDIATAIDVANRHFKDINNRNWCQKLFAALFNLPIDVEVEPDYMVHGDLNYLYVIEGKYDDWGGKHGVDGLDVTIAVYRIRWDEEYEDVMEGEPLFKGKASEYMEWLKERKD